MQRRLPIYLLLDCSESMVGGPHQAVEQGIQRLCNDLKGDPMALETAWISVIAFSRDAHQIVPLTEVLQLQPPQLPIGPGTNLGAALDLLTQCIQREVRKSTPTQKGDWKPMIFFLTDGVPTDNWRGALSRLKTNIGQNAMTMIAIGCGKDVDTGQLGQIAPTVLLLEQASDTNLSALFKWVTMSVGTVSKGLGEEGRGVQLPVLPDQVIQAPAGQPIVPQKNPSQIILAAHCSQDTRNGYLMRYCRSPTSAGTYEVEGAYSVGSDYFGEASGSPSGQLIDTGKLHGYPFCPYCRNPAWTVSANGRDLICAKTAQAAAGKTQVMFVLDVTGSMRNEINGVKDGIREFIDILRGRERSGIEVGLIAFRDVGLERLGKKPQMPEVLQFDGKAFTTDTDAFKTWVGKLKAQGGGGNAEESSLDALVLASRQRFSGEAAKVLVLITDQVPYERDGLRGDITMQTAIAAMKESRIDQLHMVLPVNQRIRAPFTPLHDQIAGKTFNLNTRSRTSKAFCQVLQEIGQSIKIMTQRG